MIEVVNDDKTPRATGWMVMTITYTGNSGGVVGLREIDGISFG